MKLAVTEEQEELREALRRFFADKSPSAEVRRLMETPAGHDPAVWRQMGEQLGLQGLAIPEAYGGAGFGMAEQVVALEEMGRSLLCAPYLGSAVLAAGALLHCGDEAARHELLPGVAAGETIACLAIAEESGSWDPAAVAMTARPAPIPADANGSEDGAAPADAPAAGAGWVLDGTKSYVLDGHLAGLVLVVARTAAGLSLFAVDGTAEGLAREVLPTLDQTRRLARLTFDGVRARLLGPDGAAEPGLERALDLAAVALAAEQLGGAARVLEMSVEYAKLRHQFGRPIGSFQAIKHKCADLLLEVESARSAVMYAARVADERPAELPVAAALARVYCSEAYAHAAAETIQIHGGIGFTWEHDAHLFFKRAKSAQLLLGPPAEHRERLATRVGI